MAQPERGPGAEGKKERWREAALGGALVALGGAFLGATRGGTGTPAKPADAGAGKPAGRSPAEPVANDGGTKSVQKSRPDLGASKVRTKPNAPEVTGRTQYWPPPPKPPDVYDDGIRPPEHEMQTAHLPVDEGAMKRGYESGDAKPGTIAKVMLGSAAVIACSIAVLFYLIGTQRRADLRAPPLTQEQRAVIVPPGPRLQDHPLHDIATENEREFDLLRSYAWTGPDHRAARIPIARARALVVGRPLDPLPPATPQPAAAPAQTP